MKTPGIYIGAIAVYCVFALVIGMAGAAGMTQQGTGNNLKNGAGQFGPEKMIDRLEQQGVDVTEVKTASQNGDIKAVKEWLQSYREAHQGERVKGTGKGPMAGVANGARMLQILDNLTAKGYDVSAIRTAMTNGDYQTAQTLMQEFRTVHPDTFPARSEGAGKGPMTGQTKGARMLQILDNLTAKGYDVSAIRTAVTSADYKTAQTLMQEFRTAYPDVFPARGEGAGSGHLGGQRRAQHNQ